MAGQRHVSVAVEAGPRRRVFAWATAWPGWCRAGRDEAAALAALVSYAARYQPVARRAELDFSVPASPGVFIVTERLEGTATTDFGALSQLAQDDIRPFTEAEIDRLSRLLSACWSTFDQGLQRIPAQARSTKPAVGRSPAMMRLHLLETDAMHMAAFNRPFHKPSEDNVSRLEPEIRSAFLAALKMVGPDERLAVIHRYGFDWTPRFAVRRAAWHALDHAWQLEDAMAQAGSATRRPDSLPSGSPPRARPEVRRRAATRRSPPAAEGG